MKEIRRIICENIKHLCAIKGIKQVEISERLGVSQGSVSNWMKGINSIDIDNLVKLCNMLGVTLNQIYGIDPINEASELPQDEQKLLSMYRLLNAEGKKCVLKNAEMCTNDPDYKKSDVERSAM